LAGIDTSRLYTSRDGVDAAVLEGCITEDLVCTASEVAIHAYPASATSIGMYPIDVGAYSEPL